METRIINYYDIFEDTQSEDKQSEDKQSGEVKKVTEECPGAPFWIEKPDSETPLEVKLEDVYYSSKYITRDY